MGITLGELFGVYREIPEGEKILVKDDMFAEFAFKEKKLLRKKELPILEDIPGEVIDLYALPCLTNKHLHLLLLVIVKKLGPFTKWWSIPLEYIDNATIKTEKKGGKKVAAINISLALPKKGLLFKKTKIDFTFYTPNIVGWQSYLAKVVEFNAILKKYQKDLKNLKSKIEGLDKDLAKGKISTEAYQQLLSKYKEEMSELEEKIKELKERGVE